MNNDLNNPYHNIHPYFENPYSPEERKKIVSENLTSIRKSYRLTQKEISSIIGVTPQTYSGYEKGKYEPNMEILVRISLLYNISTDAILGKTVNREIETSQEEIASEFNPEIVQQLQTEIAIIKDEIIQLKKRTNL